MVGVPCRYEEQVQDLGGGGEIVVNGATQSHLTKVFYRILVPLLGLLALPHRVSHRVRATRCHEHACHIRWIVLGPNVNAGVSSHVGVGVDRPTCPPARIERHIASVDAGWAHAFKFAYLRRVLGPPRRLLSRLQNLGPGWQAPRLLIREVTFSSQLLVDWEGRDLIGFPRSRAGRRCDC